jgi:hypothetical protein
MQTDLPLGPALLDEADGPAKQLDAAAAQRLAAQAAGRVYGNARRLGAVRVSRRALAATAVCASVTAAAAYSAVKTEALSSWLAAASLPVPARPLPRAKGRAATPAVAQPIELEPSVPAMLPAPEAPAPDAQHSTFQHLLDSAPARDLLAEANALRSTGKYAAARSRYLQISRHYSESRQAQVARIAAGALELEHAHAPARALELYRAADRQGGPLAAEARFGIAECYQALGQKSAEARTLAAFLRDFSDHPLRAAAEKRAEALRQ